MKSSKSSKAMDKRRKRGSRTWRPLIVVGLVLFVVVDVALVGYALGAFTPGVGDESTTPDASSTSAAPAAIPSASETPAPSTPLELLAAPEKYLAVVDETTAYRASAATCTATAATLEKTTDGGSSWEAEPVFTGLSSVFRLEAVTEANVYLAGLDSDACEPSLAVTFTSGEDFVQGPERLNGTWYSDPAVPAIINTPTGPIAAPCDVVAQLAVAGASNAAVLCNDRNFHQTTDGGRTWSGPTSLSGATALGETGGAYVFATSGSTTCTGSEISRIDFGSMTAVAVGCASSLADLTVDAISGSGQDVWLLADDQVVTSVDGGATWAS
jgi:hypothetical protein